ncbi:MAG: NAD(P)-dependent oxidoreductase [Betaproteobacteria bacterium]|nr:NAD(P)-dependent oxidoreductase [Betaproteobacteria bacterium]
MSRRALLTGGTGYIGGMLVRHLSELGWKVSLIVRSKKHCYTNINAENKIFACNGTIESIQDAVEATRPDVVFHLASFFTADHTSKDIKELINSNILFGTNLVEACARNGVKHFVNTGTAWQHFRGGVYDPVCLYAATKQAYEDLLDYYVDAFNIKVITLKLFDTYGPRDPRPKLLNLLLDALKTGKHLDLSPGNQLIDLVHVQDVISAYSVAGSRLAEGIDLPKGHYRYAVSSGSEISIRELAEILKGLSQRPLNISFGSKPYRTREVMRPWRGGEKLPGWSVQTSLRDGLATLVKI